ncbi:MAG: methyltransferase domain-containing protein [Candidatus Eisenbacteria bacterium]
MAGAYANTLAALTAQAIVPLLDAVAAGEGVRLLDVACGTGELAAVAHWRGARVTGVDLAGAMLGLARARLPEQVELRAGDAQALPFQDASFDAVTLAFVLGHLAEPEQGIREAERVLVPGGRVAFAWWRDFEHAAAFPLVFNALREHGQMDVPLPPGPPFERFGSRDECVRALADAGFAEPIVREHPLVWQVESGEALFDAFLHGTARTGGLLRAQEPAALTAMRVAVCESARAFKRNDHLELPMPIWIASARKP